MREPPHIIPGDSYDLPFTVSANNVPQSVVGWMWEITIISNPSEENAEVLYNFTSDPLSGDEALEGKFFPQVPAAVTAEWVRQSVLVRVRVHIPSEGAQPARSKTALSIRRNVLDAVPASGN